MKQKMKLIQIIGIGIEELWEFPEEVPDEAIEKFYHDWESGTKEDFSFEEYMGECHPDIECSRVYVTEIYI